MVRAVPAEAVGLNDVGQPGLVGEEKGQVCGQDAVLHVPQHLLVLIRAQLAEYIVVLLIKNRIYNSAVCPSLKHRI